MLRLDLDDRSLESVTTGSAHVGLTAMATTTKSPAHVPYPASSDPTTQSTRAGSTSGRPVLTTGHARYVQVQEYEGPGLEPHALQHSRLSSRQARIHEAGSSDLCLHRTLQAEQAAKQADSAEGVASAASRQNMKAFINRSLERFELSV